MTATTPGDSDDPPEDKVETDVGKIDLIKTAEILHLNAADHSNEANLNDTILYHVTVRNIGALDLYGVRVTDAMFAGAEADLQSDKDGFAHSGDTVLLGTMLRGEEAVITYKHTVTEADILKGDVPNTAVATGSTDPEKPDVPDVNIISMMSLPLGVSSLRE